MQFDPSAFALPEDLPPAPPAPQDLNIPDEAYGARTAFGLLDPGEKLDPAYWDEANRANRTRAAELQNQFLDRQRQILHTGPDAYLAKTGRDAVLAAPDVLAQLKSLRQATLDQAGNDAQRRLLNEALLNHAIAEHATVGQRAGEQSLAWQNQTATERLNQLNQQAAIDYGDPGAIDAYDRASEGAARERARTLNHAPDSDQAQAEVDAARSAVWRSAIQSALDKWDLQPAVDLHGQAYGRLTDVDAAALAPQIDAAKEYQAGHDYLSTLSIPATQDFAALDQAHQAATAQNTADWPDNDGQRATNQHLIDVAFGQKKQDAQQTKADLDQAVNDWLNQSGQTQRPPFAIWARLDPLQRQAADLRLARSAQGLVNESGVMSDGDSALLQNGQQIAQASPPNGGPDSSDPLYKPPATENESPETQEEHSAHGDGLRVLSPSTPLPIPLRPPARITIGPGPYSGESIRARSPDRDFTPEERAKINRIGSQTGCHTCGTKEPGTKYGNFVPDHQAPSRLNVPGTEQRLYPQCLSCSSRQGGEVTGILKARQP